MDRLCDVEMRINEEHVTPFQENFGNQKLTEDEQTAQTFDGLMFDYFRWQKSNAIRDSVMQASDFQMKLEFNLLMFCYSKILDTIITFKNKFLRANLLQITIQSLREAYEYSAQKKYHVIQLGMMHYKVEKMRKLGLPEDEILFLSTAFCSLALISIKNYDDRVINDLGFEGRVMANSNETKIAVIVAKTLGEALKIKISNPFLENVTEEKIKIQLESIKKFNKFNSKDIIKKVDEILSFDYCFSDIY